ncbi:hypothetical protein BHM03_00043889, partial [Ensete ventricosum]
RETLSDDGMEAWLLERGTGDEGRTWTASTTTRPPEVNVGLLQQHCRPPRPLLRGMDGEEEKKVRGEDS